MHSFYQNTRDRCFHAEWSNSDLVFLDSSSLSQLYSFLVSFRHFGGYWPITESVSAFLVIWGTLLLWTSRCPALLLCWLYHGQFQEQLSMVVPLLTDQGISLLPKARREQWFSRLVDHDLLNDPSLFMGQCYLFNARCKTVFLLTWSTSCDRSRRVVTFLTCWLLLWICWTSSADSLHRWSVSLVAAKDIFAVLRLSSFLVWTNWFLKRRGIFTSSNSPYLVTLSRCCCLMGGTMHFANFEWVCQQNCSSLRSPFS